MAPPELGRGTTSAAVGTAFFRGEGLAALSLMHSSKMQVLVIGTELRNFFTGSAGEVTKARFLDHRAVRLHRFRWSVLKLEQMPLRSNHCRDNPILCPSKAISFFVFDQFN